ncbi:uncharacterized protein LOC113147583 [Cyclospora cayetanensis]|uniref:Uncharacterized protein LOC113147583 n=1 Tax=Cyclospora cayetanensis TaxID=88456 RepID=A0A6P6S3H7_9EIME|nr:uncharacterized protein LOC113147583 [Cyclospora cayetanensis]
MIKQHEMPPSSGSGVFPPRRPEQELCSIEPKSSQTVRQPSENELSGFVSKLSTASAGIHDCSLDGPVTLPRSMGSNLANLSLIPWNGVAIPLDGSLTIQDCEAYNECKAPSDLFYLNDDSDIDTFTPQEVLQATRLIRMLKQSIKDTPEEHTSDYFGNPRSPKRSDGLGLEQSQLQEEQWTQGEFEALKSAMKHPRKAEELWPQDPRPSCEVSNEPSQQSYSLPSQTAAISSQSFSNRCSTESAGKKASIHRTLDLEQPQSAPRYPQAVASIPQPQLDRPEAQEFLASRGSFERVENLPLGAFLPTAPGSFPSGSNPNEDEQQEIQEVSIDNTRKCYSAVFQCPYCHRTFARRSFQKHVFFTRRKQYDMTRKRLASVVEETGLPVNSTLRKLRVERAASKQLEKPTERKWKRESAQFRAAMRMARVCDPREIAEAQAIFARCSDTVAHLQCPHCGRTFGREESLEKHASVCQRMFRNGGGVLRKGGGLCASQGAACRLRRNGGGTGAGMHAVDRLRSNRDINRTTWGSNQRDGMQWAASAKSRVAAMKSIRTGTITGRTQNS